MSLLLLVEKLDHQEALFVRFLLHSKKKKLDVVKRLIF